jgi:heme exporter protein D
VDNSIDRTGHNVSEFLAMGGYGFYVWGAYGVAALAVIAELLALRVRRYAAKEAHDEASTR